MSTITSDQVKEAIKAYVDPYLEADLVSSNSIKDISVDGDKVTIEVSLGYPAAGHKDDLAEQLSKIVTGLDGIASAEIQVSSDIATHTVQKGVSPMKNVKNIIAIASGKGGVGKSTVAVNLALGLSAEGAKVGILDADIYGPSQPRMLGVAGSKPESPDGKSLNPVTSYDLQTMSIGFLIEEDTPMIWRGPMVTQALEQLLNDTNWTDLDYLIVDLPPGTGDIQLTLAQKIPVSGAVIVTTPQDIALLDARKGLKMFDKVQVPVLGIIENMSIHICSECGNEDHIFGDGGGKRLSEEQNVDFLGALPLDGQIRADADAGKPTVVADPGSRISGIYREISRRVAAKLSQQGKDYTAKFPSIVIQNN